jgi:hypothetical protein
VGGVVINIKWKEFECREHLSQTASVRRPVRASERQSVRDYITDLTDKHTKCRWCLIYQGEGRIIDWIDT